MLLNQVLLSILTLHMIFQLSLSATEQTETPKAEPYVIFLNGCSSAGKTSLAHQLQDQLKDPFLHVGFDHFLFMLPDRYILEGNQSYLGFRFERVDDEEGPKIAIHRGIYGQKLSWAMRTTMTHLLDQGFNLIIDEGLAM